LAGALRTRERHMTVAIISHKSWGNDRLSLGDGGGYGALRKG